MRRGDGGTGDGVTGGLNNGFYYDDSAVFAGEKKVRCEYVWCGV